MGAALVVLAAYLFFCKLWPFVLYPNYLFKSKIESYPELKALAASIKNADKYTTVRNVYAYMKDTYTGSRDVWNLKNLFTVFWIGDFSTQNILNKKQFLWCHTQNRLINSILVNTDQFEENDIVIKRVYLRSFFIHQWLSIKIDEKVIAIDPHCAVFMSVDAR